MVILFYYVITLLFFDTFFSIFTPIFIIILVYGFLSFFVLPLLGLGISIFLASEKEFTSVPHYYALCYLEGFLYFIIYVADYLVSHSLVDFSCETV